MIRIKENDLELSNEDFNELLESFDTNVEIDDFDYELLDYYLKNTEGKTYTDDEARKIWGIE